MDFLSFIGKMTAQDCEVTFRNSSINPRGLEIRLRYFGGAQVIGWARLFQRHELADPEAMAFILARLELDFMAYIGKEVKRPMPLPA